MTDPPFVNELPRYGDLLKSAIEAANDSNGSRLDRSDAGQWKRQIRAAVDDSLANLVIESARLQKKACEKLGSGIWWCTARSLAQATHHQVADLKARMIGNESSVDTLFDLCCGIGADTMALARLYSGTTKRIQAVDRDPIMVAMTEENLRRNGNDSPNLRVQCSDVGSDVGSDVADRWSAPSTTVHIDPDRRDDRGRKIRPQDYSPPWEVVESIVSRCHSAMVKLAPAAEIDDLPGRHRIWISLSGSVREQTVLTGGLLEQAEHTLGVPLDDAARTAVILRSDGSMAAFHGSWIDDAGPWIDQPSQWMADPDAAIRAAGMTESFALQNGYLMLGGPAGFLTGDHQLPVGLAVCEPVIWSGPCDDRKLRKTLRSMNAFPQRIKTRGVAQDPNALEKKYRQCGEQPVTLWIGKGTRHQYAAITRSPA